MRTKTSKIAKVAVAVVLVMLTFVVINLRSRPEIAHAASLSMMGADVSSLQLAESLGQVYYNSSGAAEDPLLILKSDGVNYIRLRVWVNPASGWNNEAKVLTFAKTVKADGFKLLIDFHYSDTWADPGHQVIPSAWSGESASQMQTSLYNYTYNVCSALKSEGATPDMVQIGNEINDGMLFPTGQINNNNFVPLAGFLKSGYNATKACSSSTQVMIHIANGGEDAQAEWFFDGIKAAGVSWDVTGLSYYSMWSGTMSGMTSTVSDMRSRYGKPVVIAETAYPYTLSNEDSTQNSIYASSQLTSGYAASWTGQYDNFRDVIAAASAGGAEGVFYWEPTWKATPGNGWDPYNLSTSGDQWDNMALFNWSADPNPALALF